MRVDGGDGREVDVVDGELGRAIDEIDAACADAVDCRDVQLHHFDMRLHTPGASLEPAAVGRGRIAHAQADRRDGGDSPGAAARARPVSCALTTMFMSPWRYSSTSRERCRAIGRKPIISSTCPSACGLAL